jgi:hypothetical protein
VPLEKGLWEDAMDIELRIRVVCSGWRCRNAGLPSIFEGFVPAEVVGEGNRIKLKKPLPEGWGSRRPSIFEGFVPAEVVGEDRINMGTDGPLCPKCMEAEMSCRGCGAEEIRLPSGSDTAALSPRGNSGETLRRVSVADTSRGKVARFEGDRTVLTWLTLSEGEAARFDLTVRTDRGEVELTQWGRPQQVLKVLAGWFRDFGSCLDCGAWVRFATVGRRCNGCAEVHNELVQGYRRGKAAVMKAGRVYDLIEQVRAGGGFGGL